MSSTGVAHGLSLPLYGILSGSRDIPSWDAITQIRATLRQLNLHDHIEVTLTFSDGGHQIGLERRTEFGGQVLDELDARTHLPPCPDGECVYDGRSCIWCGGLKQ